MSDTIPTRQIKHRESIPVISPPEAADAEAKLTAFVNQQIERMRSYVQFQAGQDPTFFEINQALLTYQDTNLGLLALHNTAKMENTRAKEIFEDWYAGKYIEMRDRLNPRTLSAQKWYSQREIELQVRNEYAEEYHRYNWDVIATEQQLAFMRRLLESWASYQYVLTQLSKNLISEISSLGIEDSLNTHSV
jgi:hypothetical protein